MFGLLSRNPPGCKNSDTFRKHYCGTCKTIGRGYGQRYRTLLNHDVVLLAELFATIYPERKNELRITPFNCFKLPSSTEVPAYLKYVAAANLLLAQYKIDDNVVDSKLPQAWLVIKRLLRPGCNRARRDLIARGFPTDTLDEYVKAQFVREAACAPPVGQEFTHIVEYYSHYVAKATGLVYEQIDPTDMGPTLKSIGEEFGRVVYLSDAIEDCERDRRAATFNILLLRPSDELHRNRETVVAYIHKCIGRIKTLLALLPIPIHEAQQFHSRILLSTCSRIGSTETSVLAHRRTSSSEALQVRLLRARIIAQTWSQRLHRNLAVQRISWPIAFTFLAVVALLLPQMTFGLSAQPAQEAECCGSICKCCTCNCCEGCCGKHEAESCDCNPENVGNDWQRTMPWQTQVGCPLLCCCLALLPAGGAAGGAAAGGIVRIIRVVVPKPSGCC